jgi:hypothetical protein
MARDADQPHARSPRPLILTPGLQAKFALLQIKNRPGDRSALDWSTLESDVHLVF